jgi:hypothetical protein
MDGIRLRRGFKRLEGRIRLGTGFGLRERIRLGVNPQKSVGKISNAF